MSNRPNRLSLALVFVALAAVLAAATACRQKVSHESAAPASGGPSRTTVEQVKQWMDEGTPIVFVDSRSEASWEGAATKLPGAIRVPPHDVEPYLESIPLGRTLVVYCT